MSRLVFLSFVLVFTNSVKSQNIQGEWMINSLLIDSLVKNYTLDTLSTERFSNYGNHFKLNADGTFNSWYTAPCGNDCFTSSNGTYSQLDSNHFNFVIENVSFRKECYNRTSPYVFPLDIGSFHVFSINNKIHLIKDKAKIE
jgi:hypothetical protein